jgi:hypothetical protein
MYHTADQSPIGAIFSRLMRLHFSLSSVDMENRLEYLSTWK